MSDGLTDCARDDRRAGYWFWLVRAEAAYLAEPSETAKGAVRDAARDVDSVPRGLATGETHFGRNIEYELAKLDELRIHLGELGFEIRRKRVRGSTRRPAAKKRKAP